MIKLLYANFLRVKQDKLFWIGFGFMAAAGIFFPVRKYVDGVQTNLFDALDQGFFASALFIGVAAAVFCSMFIGTEYSDGTIRNKIIVGRKRTAIYLANVITSAVVSVILCIAFALPYLCLGIPLLGFFTSDIRMILLFGLAVLLLAVACSSIFTFIAMLCHNKATAAVVCILLAFGILLAGAILNKMLDAPKMITMYSLEIDGSMVDAEMPNPGYLEGMKREIVQLIYDILPGGQAIQCAMMTAVNLFWFPVYSFGITLLTTGVGAVLFCKKDLK